MLKKISLLLAIAYTFFLGTVSLLSENDLPPVSLFSFQDKVFHLLAYGLLCLLWYFALNQLKIERALLKAVILSLIYGTIIEVLQSQLTETRHASFGDILANSLGIVIMSLILTFRQKTIVKKK